MDTLQELRTIGYEILREEENTSAYSYTIVDKFGDIDENGSFIYWCDDIAVNANSSGEAIIKIKENV